MRVWVKVFVAAAMVSTAPIATFGKRHDNKQSAGSSAADWERVIAGDRERAAQGLIAPEDVDISIAMSKLAAQKEEILASGNEARKQAWQEQAWALMRRKAAVDSKWLAEHPVADTGARPDPCLDAAGRNTCAAPPPPTQRMCSMNYGSTVGLVPC